MTNKNYGISSGATLNETFTAKYNGVLTRTPYSETKIRNLHPKARRRASPPLSYESPPLGTAY